MWLGVSNYVSRRAGLFLKCSTLTLCKVGESAEGNTLLWAGFVAHVPVGVQLLVCHADRRIFKTRLASATWLGSDTKRLEHLWVCSGVQCFGHGWSKL